MLEIGVIGLNHKTGDLALRESIAKAAAIFEGEKARFFPHPVILLSTCNRTEIYFSGERLADVHSDLLWALRRGIHHSFEQSLYSYFGFDCLMHLGTVTAGLDSAIIAETDIQRQVKLAYMRAKEIGPLPSCMHYAFQKALKLGKFIRNQFTIDRGVPHLFQAIWSLAGKVHGQKILLVGHSKVNRDFAYFLYQRGVCNVSLVTRHPEAVSLQGVSAHGRELLKHWQQYDLITFASSSDRYLISGVGCVDQVIFDLSVPRNVDPGLQGARLYNIEMLNQWIEQRRALQLDQIQASIDLLRSEAIRIARLYRSKHRNSTKLLVFS